MYREDLPTHLPLINVKALVGPSDVGILPNKILWRNICQQLGVDKYVAQGGRCND